MQTEAPLAATVDGVLRAARLTFDVDVERLMNDLRRLRSEDRQRQPGLYHDGSWKGISLRSERGRPTAGAGLPGLHLFQDTPFLRDAPAMAELLARIPAPKLSARLLYLPPGSVIGNHVDDFTGFWHGVLRLHAPIVTNPHVTMCIGGATFTWEPGTLWYGNFCLPHEVGNNGSTERVHLVIDTLITNELLELFPCGDRSKLPRAKITLAPPAANVWDDTRFRRTLALPRAVVQKLMPSMIRRIGHGDGDWIAAQIVRYGSRLILKMNGVPVFRLEPIDETALRIANWSAGIVLRVPAAGDQNVATLEMRIARPFLKLGQELEAQSLQLPLLVDAGA